MVYKNSVQRLKEIVKIMAQYGFGFIVDSKISKNNKSPKNLRMAFEKLGPTFIKIGQILSTRPDILPPDYINELIKLQDNVPPESFEEISEVIKKDFNMSIDELFKQFDKKAFASASISQVHRAVLFDGREVLVKIQRPHIYEKMKIDISILKRILSFTKARIGETLVDPKEALDEIMESTEKELDFKIEASNMDKFKELNTGVEGIAVPYVIKEITSTHVLTMEKINGIKISDVYALKKSGTDLNRIGKNLALSFFKQVFEDGFFHGDPHPGNLLIRNGQICFIDFGIVGNIPNSLKSALNEVITSIVFNDINKLISILMSIGVRTGYVNRNQLYEDIDYLFDSYLSTSLMNIKVSIVLEEIMDISKRNNLRVPKNLVLLARSLVIIEGVLTKVSPDINMLELSKPYVISNLRKSQLKDLSLEDIASKAIVFTKNSARLPSKLIELSESLIRGRAKIQFEHKNLENPINSLNKMVNRMVAGLMVSSMIIGSSLIVNFNNGSKIHGVSVIGILGFGIAAVMALWVLISIIKSGKM
ncbi:AarF/ABC1/UbiB kinase family protein [Clostridium sp. 19966]|uniref:ABC1 kinase family protein n=1 Tax=Clostridium sp. 19966 TaxID=2768166 RepID=UPI0028DEF0D7|nr:AarF/ABC1/UbiB kinase family protein [Clostridium sp. 19966]MDT8718594.1 AarF/ABC1/UbiB kinase family protein [Clostridium sp. 19966]